ncbi:protein-export membrane protein SecD [Chlamydia ibidis]|uniref:Protein-export membrane protein SecD n=2 Tax=Chlamydia ibidis TaxID=1405396 RepID=S7J5E9_9CHLA|nr:protein translocase subunit SecDF [Chlamydia ibidis]EPP35458.1 protein-export membrane protein SecD [Chlamydia ibidis]EQM63157.1 protein-export membrane protein, SecD/SecF family [Chlamydia ibidis 10-1398/6]
MKHNFKRNLGIIVFVFTLALYYVIPTCLYYGRPLSKKIDQKEADRIVRNFINRVVDVRGETVPRVSAILSALKLRGQVMYNSNVPGVVDVHFRNEGDAQVFIENLLYAESGIPMKSSRLYVLGHQKGKTNVVQVTGALMTSVTDRDFSFLSYSDQTSSVVTNTLKEIAGSLVLGKESVCTCNFPSRWENAPIEHYLRVAKSFTLGYKVFSSSGVPNLLRYFFSSEKDFSAFCSGLDNLVKKGEGHSEERKCLENLQQLLKHTSTKWQKVVIPPVVNNTIDCSCISPFFSAIEFSPKERKAFVKINSRISSRRSLLTSEELLDLDNWIAQEKQRLARNFHATLENCTEGFSFSLGNQGCSGRIILHGDRIIQEIIEHLTTLALHRPEAISCDLLKENFPIHCRKPKENDSFGCFIFSPKKSCQHFSRGSIYVVCKGLRSIIAKYEHANREDSVVFEQDLQNLYNCFSHTDAVAWSLGEDQVLEIRSPLQRIFDALGEDFVVSKIDASAYLEVNDVRDRLETLNRIEKQRQNELVRWHEQYRQATCSMDPQVRLRAAVPGKNALVENLKLNLRKYARGDNVLRLGIDFVGGKQIRLAFKDHQGRQLTDKDDILQVSDELYSRLNKLGVAEVEIRREGENIQLSVPGSANVSSQDILGVSQMTFHVVNEKFSLYGALRYEVQRFLDYVWFSAQRDGAVTPEKVNVLAAQIFNNDLNTLPESVRSAILKLKEEGLAFSKDLRESQSSLLNTHYSMLAIERDVGEKINPLMIVFRNYALTGSSLKDIRADFINSEGYVLNFSVKHTSNHEGIPSENFHAWTSKYCQSGISGTENSQYSLGRGWRMAVILNGYVISDPVLNAPLKDHASVSGRFTHSEVTKLAADLKSGAMSFVPEILSEEVISPELGKQQRDQGVLSVFLGLLVLMVLMSVYYKFGGVIASGAVILNLLLIWASLQYLDAPLTLSGLAGIILAMGMAVDANVLVFERIREEYLLSQSLTQSVHAGYKKAFGAIFDSNLTTVLASLLLLLLDTGPIKGFALTLILGIFSSMFTALFMTKFFFVVWMNRTRETQLRMMNKFIGVKHDFLRECRRVWAISGSIIALGCVALGFGAWESVLGMDFKGGYALTLHVPEEKQINASQFRTQIGEKLKKHGLSTRDFRIKAYDASEKVKIYFSQNALHRVKSSCDKETTELEESGLSPVADLLSTSGISLSSKDLKDTQDLWLQVSGQFSQKMRRQAALALLGALVIILLYVSLRFEWRYAFSAICALIHDLVATCAVLVAMHFFLHKIQLDLQAVGALMTVLGYSLNNTLIIFDRIREDRRAKIFTPMAILINDSLQKTLGRTVMTTATTLSVLLILLFVGGGSIFNFAFIMTIGILLGTLSSLYIAPPLLLFMMRREEGN